MKMTRKDNDGGVSSSAINLIYLMTFLGVGCINSGFIAMYLVGVKGLTVMQVGVIASLKPACTFFAAPAWAAAADTSGRHKTIYSATTVGAAICRASVLLAPGFAAVVAVMMTGELLGSGSNPMLDAAVLATMEDPTRWGRHRLWGAVGYGIAVLLIGIMIDNHGFTPMYMAHVALVTSGVLLVRARLPMGRRRADASAANLKQQSHTKLSASVVWSILFSSVQRCVFFTVVLLCGVGSGVIENFLFLFLRQELHASSGIMGLGRLVTCGSEVPMFWFATTLIKRLGHLGVLAFACFCYIVRFTAYSNLTDARWYLPVETLHGITYAVMWNASASYAFEIAPEGLGATAQGLLYGVHYGIGQGLGAVLGGALYSSVGARAMFRIVTAGPAISLLLLLLLLGARKGAGGSASQRLTPFGLPSDTKIRSVTAVPLLMADDTTSMRDR